MTVFQQQHVLAALDCDPVYFDGLDGPKTQSAKDKFKAKWGMDATDDNLISALSGSIPLQKKTENIIISVVDTGDNGRRIWDRLKLEGFTDAGAAGIMGNLFAESNLQPQNLENIYEKKLGFTDESYTQAVDSGTYSGFSNDSAGYGIAQWTYWSRKRNLLAFAQGAGKSIGDLDMQTDFLLKEIREDFPSVYSTLKKTDSVHEASDLFMIRFENPADKSDAARNARAGIGIKMLEKYR